MTGELSVLSYNISWESTHPGPPPSPYKSDIKKLGEYCHTENNKCLNKIVGYLKNINDSNPIDFILLQETGEKTYDSLITGLGFGGVLHERKKCAILYRKKYTKEPLEISGNFGCSKAGKKIPDPSKQLSGRPILINFFSHDGELFVIVNVHGPHNYSARDIQNDINWLLSPKNDVDTSEIMKGRSDISVVVGGDFNQKIDSLNIKINNDHEYTVSARQIPNTCCDGEEINNPNKRSFNRPGDIILTNRDPSQDLSQDQYSDLFVPKGAYDFIASDHLPVRSVTKKKSKYSEQDLNNAFELLIQMLQNVRPKKLRNIIISTFKSFFNNQQKVERLDQLSRQQGGGGDYLSKTKKKTKKSKKKKKKKSLKKTRVISDKKYKEYIQKKKTKKKLTKKQHKDLDKILFVKYCKCIKTLKNNKKIKKNLEYPICMSSVYSKRGFKAPKNVKKKCKQLTN